MDKNRARQLAGLQPLAEAQLDEAFEPNREKFVEDLTAIGAELEKLRAALSAAKKATNNIERSFEQHIYNRNLSNIDTPNEYGLWVNVKNLKDLHGLSTALNDTLQYYAAAMSRAKAYTPSKGLKS